MTQQPSITLYYTPMTSSVRAQWALEELGLRYDKKKIDLKSGEQRTPEFLKLNPNGKVPVIVIDGKPIFESLAMVLYLGDTYGVDKGLFPASGTQRALAYQWIVWAGVTLNEAVLRVMRNTAERFPDDEKNAKAAQSARKDVQKLLGILESALDGREYLLGSSFSFVDLAVSSWAGYLRRVGVDTSSFPRLNAWQSRCADRPAMARATQD
jgi:glutathione S-transferase